MCQVLLYASTVTMNSSSGENNHVTSIRTKTESNNYLRYAVACGEEVSVVIIDTQQPFAVHLGFVVAAVGRAH